MDIQRDLLEDCSCIQILGCIASMVEDSEHKQAFRLYTTKVYEIYSHTHCLIDEYSLLEGIRIIA